VPRDDSFSGDSSMKSLSDTGLKRMDDSRATANYFFGSPLKLFAWGAALLLVAALLKVFLYGPSVPVAVSLAHEILRDLGIALIVSCGIVLAVERHADKNREEILRNFSERSASLMHDVSNKTLESYFKLELPGGWHQFIRDLITSSSFMRYNTKLDFLIEAATPKEIQRAGRNDFAMSEFGIRYDVQNISGDPAIFPVVGSIGLFGDGALKTLIEIVDFEIDGLPLPPKELAKARSSVPDTDHYWTFRHEIKLGPKNRSSIYVRARAPRRIEDSYVYTTRDPGQGLEVSAVAGDGMSLQASILHPKLTLPPQLKVADRKREVVSTEHPVLPYSAVQFSWRIIPTTELATVFSDTATNAGQTSSESSKVQGS
jgi:hypothetical protein